jgi:hypothetical protein
MCNVLFPCSEIAGTTTAPNGKELPTEDVQRNVKLPSKFEKHASSVGEDFDVSERLVQVV